MKKIIACNTAIALSALSLNALAQDPAGLTSVDQASSGSANVATTGFQSAQKPAEETTDFTRLTLGAGGMIARGNSQVQNYNALGDFGLRRGANQLAVKASLNQGSSSSQRDPDGTLPEMQENVSNYQGMLRYDRFFSEVVSGFVQASALTDKFQGVDLRLNIDPGIAIYAINEADHQWSFDVGYDFQYEDYRDEAIEPLTLHNARVATNYVNAVNESVTFKTGAEYLLALSPWEQCYWVTESSASIRANECDETKPNDAIEKVARVNWSLLAYARLDAKVSDKFAVQTALELRHDNSPVQLNYAMNDLRSSVNLTYQLF
jgi:putative salt-induced outer membrane protein YdiY